MIALLESLSACGYQGPCNEQKFLAWAMRVGACSEFFKDLLNWLERELQETKCSALVRENINNLFRTMRSSMLMKPHLDNAPETILNPKEYRIQTVKVLLNQLQLARRSIPPTASGGRRKSPTKGEQPSKQIQKYSDLRITLTTENTTCGRSGTQRSVRLNPKFYNMYE